MSARLKPRCTLSSGCDEPFAVIGRVSQALRKAGQMKDDAEFAVRANDLLASSPDDLQAFVSLVAEYVEVV